MENSNDRVSFNKIVQWCSEVLYEELDRPLESFEISLLVCAVLPELNPDLEAWPVVTRAMSFSAKSAALLLSDASDEEVARHAGLPGYTVLDVFASLPDDLLGTFDEDEGFLLGHACVLVWAKTSDRYYLLDPAQEELESDDDEIRFDRLAMIEVQMGQKEVRLAFDNGVTVLYWLYPEAGVPDFPEETLSKVMNCVPQVLDMLLGSDDD